MATQVEQPQGDYATKAELQALEHRIDAGFTELRHAIELIAASTRTDMANLRTDMERFRTDMESLRTDFADFKADIKIDVANRHNAQVKWLIGVALAAIVVILATLELIPRFWPLA